MREMGQRTATGRLFLQRRLDGSYKNRGCSEIKLRSTMLFNSWAQEGHHGAIWEVSPSMEMILHDIRSLKNEYWVAISFEIYYE